MSRLFFLVVILLSKFSTVFQTETFNYVYLDEEKAFKLYWAYDDSTDIVNFVLEVNTLGWIGFGFANKINRMENYDVVVGKIQNGKESLTDRFTSGYREPLADRYQDYKLTGFNESNGKTFLEFHRKRNTGDNNDIEIKSGPMLLVYAYHTLDYPSPYKTKHEKQGFKMVTLIPADNDTTELGLPELGFTVTRQSLTTANNQLATTPTVPNPAEIEMNKTAIVPRSGSSNTRAPILLHFPLLFVQILSSHLQHFG